MDSRRNRAAGLNFVVWPFQKVGSHVPFLDGAAGRLQVFRAGPTSRTQYRTAVRCALAVGDRGLTQLDKPHAFHAVVLQAARHLARLLARNCGACSARLWCGREQPDPGSRTCSANAVCACKGHVGGPSGHEHPRSRSPGPPLVRQCCIQGSPSFDDAAFVHQT